jgi:hypothetical protein
MHSGLFNENFENIKINEDITVTSISSSCDYCDLNDEYHDCDHSQLSEADLRTFDKEDLNFYIAIWFETYRRPFLLLIGYDPLNRKYIIKVYDENDKVIYNFLSLEQVYIILNHEKINKYYKHFIKGYTEYYKHDELREVLNNK